MTRVLPLVAFGATALILIGAVTAPPLVTAPPITAEQRVQKDFGYRPNNMTARQSATYTSSSVGFEYTGIIGPNRPLDVGAIELATGKYLISFSLPARFAGLTADPLVCTLVEARSGIPLEPSQTASYASGAAWTVLQVDSPMALPEMTVALRCATDTDTVGHIEIGESSLLAMKIV